MQICDRGAEHRIEVHGAKEEEHDIKGLKIKVLNGESIISSYGGEGLCCLRDRKAEAMNLFVSS